MNLRGDKVAGLALVTIGILVMILVRLGVDQAQWYGIALEKMNSGDKKGAVMYFDRVLNAHIPFSPLEAKARRHLSDLATGFEKAHELDLALLCYETMRTSQYLTRSTSLPFSKDIPFLNERIAAVKTRLLAGEEASKESSAEYERQKKILERGYPPSTSLSLATSVSFIAYLLFVTGWIITRKRHYLSAGVLFFVVWMITLYSA